MEIHQTIDNRIRLYLTTAKPLIYAGQYLQATVHVQVLENTPCKSINISLVGKEKVEWSETNKKISTQYKNEIQTYREELVLDIFQYGLQKGNYSFPFNILIPAALPASLAIDQNNYISYILTVFVPSQDNQSTIQKKQLPLHIRQPLRSIFEVVSQGTKVVKCCGCFGNRQSGLFHIETDRNQIHYTDKFKVRAVLDNSNGKFSFEEIGLVLTRRIVKVSSDGAVNSNDEDMGVFYRSNKPLDTGRKKKFEIQVNLPPRIVEHSAIGNIISRCYFITLIGYVECCYNDCRVEKHILLNNEVPPTKKQNDLEKKLENWKSQVKPPVSFVNLKPYLYKPSPGIKVHNQKGEMVSPVLYNQTSAKSLFRTE